MELALNIVWFAIALVALATALSHRRKLLTGIALLCVVALLFPIISITDDLRCDVVFVEASVKRRGSDANHQARTTTAVALGVIAILESFNVPPCVGLAAIERCVGTNHDDLCSVPARAPPQRTC